MPTIIALDVSLSMQRPIPLRTDESLNFHTLACKGVSLFFEHLTNISKLEYVSLVTYSTTAEMKIDFTRDYDQIKQAVKKAETGNKLCLISMLKSVAGIFSTNWGLQDNCQVVVFTNCGLGFGSTALAGFLKDYAGKEDDPEYAWLQSLKQIKLNFICMGVHSDQYFTLAISVYQEFINMCGLKGQLFMTKPPVKDNIENEQTAGSDSSKTSTHSAHKSELGRTAMFEMVERLCETNFKPLEVTLKCGGYFRLECTILIWPPPTPYIPNKCDQLPRSISQKLEICGFVPLSDIGSPASFSRHLILPKFEREREKSSRRSSDKSSNSSKSKLVLDVNNPNYEFEKLEQDIRDFYTKEGKDTDESGDDNDVSASKTNSTSITDKESLCVLLHGALKVENVGALVLLNENWFGFIYAHSDSKKKSNLLLIVLPPGNDVVPWLGDLQLLGFADDLMPGETATFPVKAEKRSYAQSCVVWIKQSSLQSDVQKVLRHAKKMPDKTQQFYKELNRIRRAALSIGFVELLEVLASLFEKECLSVVTNKECIMQLQHVAMELRKPTNRDIKQNITPVSVPKYAGSSGENSTTGYVY